MKKYLFLNLLVLIVLVIFVPGARADSNIIRITNNVTSDKIPLVSNGQVAWEGGGSRVWTDGTNYFSEREVMFYNGVSIEQLTKNDFTEFFDFDNGQAVWTNFLGIFFFDGATTTQISAGSFFREPKISNGQFVVSRADSEILFYDGFKISVLFKGSDARWPDIDKGRVVWRAFNTDRPNGFGGYAYDIYFFDGTSIKNISSGTTPFYKGEPKIYGDQVIWYGYDGNDYEIFLFDGQKTTQLTSNSFDDISPVLNNGYVAWSGFDGQDYEILTFDGLSVTQITNNSYNDGLPDIYGNYIVWQGDIYPKVFFYDGKNIKRLTFFGGRSYAPKISQNEIVWTEWDGNDYEIILYKISPFLPDKFWSEIKNSPEGWLNLRKTPGATNKPADDIIKTAPNGWSVKVASTTDAAGNNIEIDGYRWYKIEDTTDGAVGWLAAKNLTIGTNYLNYDSVAQADLQKRAEDQLDTKDKRSPVILTAVNSYHSNATTTNFLYGAGGVGNNFQLFISGANFIKELILSIIAQESGGYEFNNEQCSTAKDGGIGIMQITSNEYKGLGSGLVNIPRINDCNKKYGWTGDFSKYYSNSLQGIYANIKDGFRVLQEKYRRKCPKESTFISGLEFTCQDIEKILTTWGYNGFIKDEKGNYIWHYLREVADKLENLSSYFSGVIYNNFDNLIEKLKIADANKQIFKVYSPVNFQIIDSQNKITGVTGNQIKEEIPSSLYEPEQEAAVIFFPFDSYKYRLIGKEDGNYGLLINNTINDASSTFNAINIPIRRNEVHQYVINWNKMSRCEKGAAILEIDREGDGIFDRTVSYDCELTDIELPQITILPIQNDYLLNSQLQVQFSATDNISGVSSISASINGETIFSGQTIILSKPGVNVIRAVAIDNEGNEAVLEKSFNVLYNFGGFLPPIKVDGSGVYNQGRTLPVKFRLTDVSDIYAQNAVAYLYLAKIDNNIVGNDEIVLSTSVADVNNQFRYDTSTSQYIHNLSTDALTPGTWQLKVILESGQIYVTSISIR